MKVFTGQSTIGGPVADILVPADEPHRLGRDMRVIVTATTKAHAAELLAEAGISGGGRLGNESSPMSWLRLERPPFNWTTLQKLIDAGVLDLDRPTCLFFYREHDGRAIAEAVDGGFRLAGKFAVERPSGSGLARAGEIYVVKEGADS